MKEAALDAAVSVMLRRALMVDTVVFTTSSAVRVAVLEIFKATCTPWMSAISVVRRSNSAETLLSGTARYAHTLGSVLQMEMNQDILDTNKGIIGVLNR